MKKILSVALSTAMAFSMFASVAFGETATTPQAKFDALAAKGILNGYPDGQAHLEKDLTRAEFAKIVTKLFGLTEVTGKLSYNDKGYTATNWAVPYIEAVTAANLMQGKDTVKGIFDYNGKVTVEEVAAVLFRALKLETPATTDNSASAWAKGYAQAVINAGLVAQGTNFKANATRSLVVEAAYAVDNLTAVPTVASAEALSPTSVFVTFSDKTTTTVTLTTALVANVETTINFTNNGHNYTAKVTLAAPKVVSVTAPNSKQIVVKFNRSIDADSLIQTVSGTTSLIDGVVSLSKLGDAPAVNADIANAVLAADGTEAWITLAGTEYLKGQYAFTLTDKVNTSAGEDVAAYTTLLTVADTTAPTIASVSSVAKATTTKVTVKFSEPVVSEPNGGGIIAYVNGATAAVVKGSTLDEIVLTTSTLETGKTYDVSLLNVKDFAGNYITPNPTKTTVTVVSDVAAPTISSFTVTGERTAKLVFNKDVDINSLYGSITLLDSNGVKVDTFDVTAGSDKKTFTLKAPSFTFPTSGSFSGTVVFGSSIRDVLGNLVASSSSQAVSFAKDTTAPTVVSATYGSTGLTVKFSETVNPVVGAQYTLISDATGNPTTKTVSTATYSTSNDSKDILFKDVTGLSAGNYTLRLTAGLVKDTSAQANGNAASVHTVAITATTSTDTSRPVVVTTPYAANTGNADQNIIFGVKDVNGLNITTVRDVNNYTLAGKALPAGSYITTDYSSSKPVDSEVTVTLYIPRTGIDATKSFDFVINGIQDTAGNTITPVVQSVALADGIAPKLASASVSTDDSKRLIVNFSEDVVLAAGDLEFKVNGVTIKNVTADGGSGSKYFFKLNATEGTYNNSRVLYVENGTEGIQASEIIAYTSDAAGAVNLSATYVNNITVTVVNTATKDTSGNVIVKDTTVNGK